MVFIRKNKYILAMILGIVSMALMFPSITNMIKNMKDTAASGYDISVQIVLVLIEYICIFLSELIFIIIGARRMMDKILFLCALILYYASEIAIYGYQAFGQGNYSSIYNILISILCIVAVFVSLVNRRFVISSVVLFLIDAAFALSGTFTGSTVSLSSLILIVLLTFFVLLYNSNVDDVSYDTYS